MMLNKFFVYGTLCQGERNHRVINPDHIEKIEEAQIVESEIYMHPCGQFPCLVEGQGIAFGQIITIKRKNLTEALMHLDNLEGYNKYLPKEANLYNRKKIEAYSKSGNIEEVFVYVYNTREKKSLGPKIESGDFRDFMKSKK